MNADALWKDLPLAVVDVETTGLDPKVDRVIEIAVIHMQGGQVTDAFATLVDPEQEIPEEVVRLTGIQPEQLTGAPRFAAIAAEVRARLCDRVFVAYNLPFDRAFITEELGRAGLDFPDVVPIDPLVFIRELHKKEGSKRLTAVAERLGITLSNAHRAQDDAEVAGHVLYALGKHLPDRLGDLRMLQEQWEQQQKNEMASWRGRPATPSAQPTSTAKTPTPSATCSRTCPTPARAARPPEPCVHRTMQEYVMIQILPLAFAAAHRPPTPLGRPARPARRRSQRLHLDTAVTGGR